MKKDSVEEKKSTNEKRSKIIKRLVFDTVIFLIFLIVGLLLLKKSMFFETEKIIKYTDKGDLDYKVYLNENDFYETEYLGKDMLYVASLIDKVVIDFDYTFASEVNEDIDFTYKVVATLAINSPTGVKSYYEKSYNLLDERTINMKDTNSQNIKEIINIDYQYYNELANKFKRQYGVDSESKLTVFMLVNKKNPEGSNFTLDSIKVMKVEIPLSERSIDIRMDYNDIDDSSSIIMKKEFNLTYYLPIIISVLFILLSVVMMLKGMRNASLLRYKKSEYDKYIGKILKEYDRLIAETTSLLSFDGKEIVNVNKFSELIDIHDNLQLPIIYYEIEKHKESYFYISHENVVYLLKVDSNNIKNMK